MSGLLVRVGIDLEFGEWNAPCAESGDFCYVPMGGGPTNEEYDPRYHRYHRAVARFLNAADRHHRLCRWPRHDGLSQQSRSRQAGTLYSFPC
jgi:hypothetical protein